jgi:hypothetical protein
MSFGAPRSRCVARYPREKNDDDDGGAEDALAPCFTRDDPHAPSHND